MSAGKKVLGLIEDADSLEEVELELSEKIDSIKEIKAELVQLENGDVVLREIDKDQEPLLRFSFSDNIDGVLRDAKLDITRSMLEAGIKRYQELLL